MLPEQEFVTFGQLNPLLLGHYRASSNAEWSWSMWLPTPVYERIPDFWVLLSLLFFALALYIGIEFDLFLVYLAVGIGCLSRAIWIYSARIHYRLASKGPQRKLDSLRTSEIELDQTGATHV